MTRVLWRLALLSTSGCLLVDDESGDSADSGVDPSGSVTTGAFPAGFRALTDGVVFLPSTCDPGSAEDCDARDDDCDGQIDEDCGLTGGDGVQVVLFQDVDADLALSVESPIGGHRLNRGAEDVEYGGRFQLPRAESCGFSTPSDYVQSAFWDAPAPGTYRVDFSVYSGCDAFPGDIDLHAEIGVAVAGTFVGTFRFPHHQDPFASSALVPILEFVVE